MLLFIKNNYYIRRIWLFIAVFLFLELVEMACVVLRDRILMDWSVFSILEMGGDFLIESCVVLCYLLLPFLIYLWILPQKRHLGRGDRLITMIWFTLFTGLVAFGETAEFLFWDEFSVRFNFIAVDYLVYTKEVIGNIWESYPLFWIILSIVIIAAIAAKTCGNFLFPKLPAPPLKIRVAWVACSILLCITAFFSIDIKDAEKGDNKFNNELSKNGLYALFSAFIKNELKYSEFYPTRNQQEAAAFLRGDLSAPNLSFSLKDDSIEHTSHPDGPPMDANIMIVIMESMGSEFLNEKRIDGANLTPNLSSLSRQGIFFPNTYASGTRSVRGLEAVSTAIPPLPGMAIVRRKDNENIQTIGSVFADRGYERKWIYGGYGLFDNMNAYFGGNGFNVVDRTNLDNDEITHTTIWGVCDEDLFKRAVKEASKSWTARKPFLNIVFTTSNHRPYTYPEGKIDIPSKTGREGAVKYADYAVGELIRQSKEQPWFDNTIFIFIADHGAGSAGKKELNPETHLIPLIIYAPKLIQPQRFDYPISQIDTMATLLGVMNIPYTISSYGKDARLPGYKPRYFISNYQNLGYFEDGVLVALKPVRETTYYVNGEKVEETPELQVYRDKAISYYQHASDWRRHLSLSTKQE